ncbi:MAG: VWA domain-containing protein [Planctomycetota bacterium]
MRNLVRATIVTCLLSTTSALPAQPIQLDFFGEQVYAAQFYWCFDTSGSIGSSGQLTPLKAELIAALQQLTPAHRFGMVQFSSGFQKFSPVSLQAGPQSIQNAIAWVNTVTTGGASCAGSGLVATLEVANGSLPFPSPRLIFVSDGGMNCPGAATEVPQATNANWQQIPIDVFHIGNTPLFATGLQALASANGGNYYYIGQLPTHFLRADPTEDGNITVADAIFLLQYVFGTQLSSCTPALDVDGDGAIDVSDAIELVQYLFVQGPPPPAPFPVCGPGSAAEYCHSYSGCP